MVQAVWRPHEWTLHAARVFAATILIAKRARVACYLGNNRLSLGVPADEGVATICRPDSS
jgi:hypothetical protein